MAGGRRGQGGTACRCSWSRVADEERGELEVRRSCCVPSSAAGRSEEDEGSHRRHQISQSPLDSFLLTLARRGRFPLPLCTPRFPFPRCSISLPAAASFPARRRKLPPVARRVRVSQLSAALAYAHRVSDRLSGTKRRLTPKLPLLPLAQRYGLAQR